jgi:anaerobic ribonucleoside-triphosphate reductase activating protein
MLKYLDTAIGFQEVPNEVAFCINITNCPCQCKGCHTPELAQDIGNYLTEHEILKFKCIYGDGITCICLMGGDSDPAYINEMAKVIKGGDKPFKCAWYSGRQYIPDEIDLKNFDYIKIGPYIEKLGPLNNPNTNQQFFRIDHCESKDFIVDITSTFWLNGPNSFK